MIAGTISPSLRSTDSFAHSSAKVTIIASPSQAATIAALAALLVWLGGDLDSWLAARPVARALRLGGCIMAGGVGYLAALWLAGLRPAQLRSQI